MDLPRVAIVFHSITGNTRRLADAVREGVHQSGAEALLLQVEGRHIVEGRFVHSKLLEAIDAADAVVFGAPTFMGGPSAQFKAFADASGDRWERQQWRGKLAAGFTTGTALNGDQTSTLQYFAILAAQHGMLWLGLDKPAHADPSCPNRLGVQLGASAAVGGLGVEEFDLQTARYLGARTAIESALRPRATQSSD